MGLVWAGPQTRPRRATLMRPFRSEEENNEDEEEDEHQAEQVQHRSLGEDEDSRRGWMTGPL